MKAFDDKCFENAKIAKIIIPKNIVKISSYMFSNCDKLSEITFQEGYLLKELGEGSFYNCISLQEIILPDGVKVIPKNCFYNTGIIAITIQNTIEIIDDSAFEKCAHLETVTFESGSSLKKLGN